MAAHLHATTQDTAAERRRPRRREAARSGTRELLRHMVKMSRLQQSKTRQPANAAMQSTHTPYCSTSHRCSGRCRRPVQGCLRSSRRLIHCARKSSSERALTEAGASGLRRINNKTKPKQNPAAARAPLADGRHLAFESVCTLVASAAGFNERDATAGPQTSTSAQFPG